MKISEIVEINRCDFCQDRTDCYNQCMRCGKDICYECTKIHAKEYGHAVYFGGSGDGLYCNTCDVVLTVTGDPLHSAYITIVNLKTESKNFYDNFKIRADNAEVNLKKIQDRLKNEKLDRRTNN